MPDSEQDAEDMLGPPYCILANPLHLVLTDLSLVSDGMFRDGQSKRQEREFGRNALPPFTIM